MFRMFLGILATTLQLFAMSAHEQLSSPTLEARALALCRQIAFQGQSIDESLTSEAAALRLEVRHMIQHGATDDVIKHKMVQRFGTRALITPPVEEWTMILWLMPIIVLLSVGGVILRQRLR